MREHEYYTWRLAGTNHPGPGQHETAEKAKQFGEDWIRMVGKREPGENEVEVWRHLQEKVF